MNLYGHHRTVSSLHPIGAGFPTITIYSAMNLVMGNMWAREQRKAKVLQDHKKSCFETVTFGYGDH